MGEAYSSGIRGKIAARFLSLAAAPTFAMMALVTAVHGSGSPDVLCSTQHVSPLSGMFVMYVLMSLFHSAPWLKLWTGGAAEGARPPTTLNEPC